MANNNSNLGCTILAISAIILAISTFTLFNKPENFTEVSENVVPTFTPGNSLTNTQALENYQNTIRMNIGTNPSEVNKIAAQYYLDLQNYLNPSKQNLELASNISSEPINAGVPLPGASSSYSNKNGNGYVNNLGYLSGQGAFAPVAYSNERASQLSKCAKDLPMFAASSLLPKPSSNADSNALSQDAARALAAWTNLSPAEQIGALTTIGNLPYGTTVSERPIPLIPQSSILTPMFNGPGTLGTPITYGSFNSTYKPTVGPNNYVYQNGF
jgi:hypothetical protein